jgi:hypothetical protein
MKTKILITAILVFVFFASCKKDEDNANTQITVNPIVGKWNLSEKYFNEIANNDGNIEFWDIKSSGVINRNYNYADENLTDVIYTDTWKIIDNNTILQIDIDRWVQNKSDSIHVVGSEIYSIIKLETNSLIVEQDLSYEQDTAIIKSIFIKE